MAVVNSFDAMVNDWPYRKGMDAHRAAAILREGRWRQWDGEIVDAFLRSIAGQLDDRLAPPLAKDDES